MTSLLAAIWIFSDVWSGWYIRDMF